MPAARLITRVMVLVMRGSSGLFAIAAIILTASHAAYAFNGTPVSLFCACPCSGSQLTPGNRKVFALTDVTIANNQGNPAEVRLLDDTTPKSEYFVPAEADSSSSPGPVTFTQSYQTPLIFKTKVKVDCEDGSGSNTAVTISGLIGFGS